MAEDDREDIQKVVAYLTGKGERLLQSMKRSRDLIALSQSASLTLQQRDEILRSSVVFTHAMIEDCLRTMGRHELPKAGREVLNKIPLRGKGRAGSIERTFLGDLIPFRGGTVDDVIQVSVDEYLSRESFNNATDIAAFLAHIGLKSEGFQEFFPMLDATIKRRHKIVHNGDYREGTHKLERISTEDVSAWHDNARDFCLKLMTDLININCGTNWKPGKGPQR